MAKQGTDASVVGYLYDHKRLLNETDDIGGDVTKTYASDTTDEFGDLIGEDGEYAHQYDAQANTDALLDDAGVVQARYKYTAFGQVSAVSLDGGAWSAEDWQSLPLALSSHMLAGGKKQYYLDFETSMYLLGSGNSDGGGGRYYDAATARFLSEDPTRQAGGGPNLYAYVHDNPVNHLDPSGHEADDKDKAKPTPPANGDKSAQPGQGPNPLSRRQQHDLERRERYAERAEARAERHAQRQADRAAHQMHRGHETDPWWQATLDSQYGPMVSDSKRWLLWQLQHPGGGQISRAIGNVVGGGMLGPAAQLAKATWQGLQGLARGEHSQDTTPKSTDAVPTADPPTAGPKVEDATTHPPVSSDSDHASASKDVEQTPPTNSRSHDGARAGFFAGNMGGGPLGGLVGAAAGGIIGALSDLDEFHFPVRKQPMTMVEDVELRTWRLRGSTQGNTNDELRAMAVREVSDKRVAALEKDYGRKLSTAEHASIVNGLYSLVFHKGPLEIESWHDTIAKLSAGNTVWQNFSVAGTQGVTGVYIRLWGSVDPEGAAAASRDMASLPLRPDDLSAKAGHFVGGLIPSLPAMLLKPELAAKILPALFATEGAVGGIGQARMEAVDQRLSGKSVSTGQEWLAALGYGTTGGVTGWLGGKLFNWAPKLPGLGGVKLPAIGGRLAVYGTGGAALSGGEKLAENAIAKSTIDPTRGISDHFLESTLTGGLSWLTMGGFGEAVHGIGRWWGLGRPRGGANATQLPAKEAGSHGHDSPSATVESQSHDPATSNVSAAEHRQAADKPETQQSNANDHSKSAHQPEGPHDASPSSNTPVLSKRLQDAGFKELITLKHPAEEPSLGRRTMPHKIMEGKIRMAKTGWSFKSQTLDIVIMKDGRVFVGKGHSIMSGGQDVAFAGQLKFNGKGDIIEITNLTGHYETETGKGLVDAAIKYLKSLGVDMSKARGSEFMP